MVVACPGNTKLLTDEGLTYTVIIMLGWYMEVRNTLTVCCEIVSRGESAHFVDFIICVRRNRAPPAKNLELYRHNPNGDPVFSLSARWYVAFVLQDTTHEVSS